jgi:hypothetical protein
MDFLSSGDGIGALSNLLQESSKAAESKSESLAPMALNNTSVVMGSTKIKIDPKAIWNDDEIPEEDELMISNDSRPTPKYEFVYKQSVGTEDTYFGLGDKTPASSDCTHLLVKVHFPNCTLRDLDLDVTKNRIKVESKTHKLFTYLPVDVHHEQGQAKFDSKKSVLTVTLPIQNSLYDSP